MNESIRRVASVAPPQFLDVRKQRRDAVLHHLTRAYTASQSIRRLFLQAMDHDGCTAVVEELPETGVVADENASLRKLDARYRMSGLHRVSFWKKPLVGERQLADAAPRDFLGYAILKEDRFPCTPSAKGSRQRWHVFESVLGAESTPYRYVPCARDYSVRIGGRSDTLKVRGVLYGEQNGRTKSCAQVALRSLASLHTRRELSFGQINDLAAQHVPSGEKFDPCEGLSSTQIEGVLKALGISCQPLNYEKLREQKRYLRLGHYQRFLYTGLENGWGALLGFRTAAKKAVGHVVPVFGHTFNRHAWVPHSGWNPLPNNLGQSRYVTSDAWLSSFIMHDDMHGPNFCLPRFYLKPEMVDYVAALLPPAASFGGTEAETLAADCLDWLPAYFPGRRRNQWLGKLAECRQHRQVILRAVIMTRREYVRHLRSLRDWGGAHEEPAVCDFLAELSEPDEHVWVVEFSLPDLFPYGGQKLGEIVLDARNSSAWGEGVDDYAPLLFGRFPGIFLFYVMAEGNQRRPVIRWANSRLGSPTPVHSRDRGAARLSLDR